jgi:2-C-methyl-D-erythritol 4-phosphate cytidylyltransferase
MAKFAVVLAAAGKSSRFQDKNYKKPFARLKDRAVWLHCADKFLNRDDVVQTLIVIAPEDRERFMDSFGANVAILGIDVVEGGAERSDSVANALKHVKDEVEYVAVHDAARPCLATEWIDRVFLKAATTGAAMLAIPITGTVKSNKKKGVIEETVPRDNLWEAQTPQVFRKSILLKAYAQRGDQPATDDAELVQRIGQPVTVVTGSPINLKITTKEDLQLAANALNALPKPKLPGASHPFADDDLWR